MISSQSVRTRQFIRSWLASRPVRHLNSLRCDTHTERKGIELSHYFRTYMVLMGLIGLTRADEVTSWNRTATTVAAAGGQNGIVQTRTTAIVHIAIYDAVNAVGRRYRPYLMETSAPADASPDAAIATAAHDTLAELVPTQQANVDAAYKTSLDMIPDGPAKTNGIAAGRAAAAAIIRRRSADGYAASVVWPPGVLPGEYRPTPPANAQALLPHWGKVLPFAMRTGDQFRSDPPPDLFSETYAAQLNEVRNMGAEASSLRTDEQSEIARHWYEPSVQGWNRIARNLAESRNIDLSQSSRLFALVNVAMADAFIAGMDSKYYYNFWRPITAIREAYLDGNSETEGDIAWNSYLIAPAVPDWPSTHSCLGAAAATVLAGFFGTDLVSFEFTSGAPYAGTTRRYYSLWQAALENANSRVLAGIHFRATCVEGLKQGQRVGEHVLKYFFRPVQ
jgi:PAP2 superfamily protein